MRERPILFSAPMVRAICEGRKTQTRRVAKRNDAGRVTHAGRQWHIEDENAVAACPYGQSGDRLWVREAWQYSNWTEDGQPYIRYKENSEARLCDPPIDWADRLLDIWAGLSHPGNLNAGGPAADRRWRPSIHMPRWASRIDLEVTGVRVERLKDISNDDAHAEGVEWDKCPRFEMATHYSALIDYVGGFRKLWQSINGPDSWDANPWVWVVEFERL